MKMLLMKKMQKIAKIKSNKKNKIIIQESNL